MHALVRVGMAELAILRAPGELTSLGLGSCVAVCLYDCKSAIAGLSHVMLPQSEPTRSVENPGKYADTAVPLLIQRMAEIGASCGRLQSVLVGGAEMFSFAGRGLPQLRIGERNICAVQAVLQELGIPIAGQNVGGKQGRSLVFDAGTGVVHVKTLAGERSVIQFDMTVRPGKWSGCLD